MLSDNQNILNVMFVFIFLFVFSQNDPGQGDLFSTFVKATIFCRHRSPYGLAYRNLPDFEYRDISKS